MDNLPNLGSAANIGESINYSNASEVSVSRYPFSSYPRGWFKIAFSDDVKPNKTSLLHYFGREIACFRDSHGKAHVVICDGTNESWPVHEINGIIFVHYDPARREPRFSIPVVSEYESDEWTNYHRLQWKVRGHVEEIAENAVDYSHFVELHTYEEIPSVRAFEISNHNFRVVLESRRKCVGGMMTTRTDIKYHGLGIVVSPVCAGAWTIVAVLTPTPIDDEYIEINLSILFKKAKNPLKNFIASHFVMPDIRREFERDIPIWENKIYHTIPRLCANDGPIMKLRKWAKQFYGELDEQSLATPMRPSSMPRNTHAG